MPTPEYDPTRPFPPEPSNGPRGDGDILEGALHYLSLVERGLVGNPPPPNPRAIAIREHNEALWRKLRFA